MTAGGGPPHGAPREPSQTRPSLILDVSTRAVFHAAVVFAVWLLAAGHNQPGGGFVGGLTLSAALVLIYAGGGSPALRRVLPVQPLTFLGVGMLVAQAAAGVPLLLGGSVLQSAAVTLHAPVLGEVKVTTTLFFDIGVLLIVLGLVAKALDTLGAADPVAEQEATAASRDALVEEDHG